MSSGAREAADRMHSAAIHLLRRVSRDDQSAGVSPARLSALSVLVFAGPQTISELAMMERVKVPTMSRLVAAMEAEALVRRERHGTDGRVVVLTCELHFPSAHSLKEKRHHLRSAKAQLQHRVGASVAEVDHHDVWQRTRLTVACVAC